MELRVAMSGRWSYAALNPDPGKQRRRGQEQGPVLLPQDRTDQQDEGKIGYEVVPAHVPDDIAHQADPGEERMGVEDGGSDRKIDNYPM